MVVLHYFKSHEKNVLYFKKHEENSHVVGNAYMHAKISKPTAIIVDNYSHHPNHVGLQ